MGNMDAPDTDMVFRMKMNRAEALLWWLLVIGTILLIDFVVGLWAFVSTPVAIVFGVAAMAVDTILWRRWYGWYTRRRKSRIVYDQFEQIARFNNFPIR